jgi:hypothetical protein
MTENIKGDGFPGPNKTRWVMRHSNGDEFTTAGHYTHEEVNEWEVSRPVRPAQTERVVFSHHTEVANTGTRILV